MESAVAQVRATSDTWNEILTKSAWFQAVGSLVDAVATKVIADVMEMPSIGQDEAYNIANMIAKITELDDLFPPARAIATDEPVPSTSQYVPSWLRLKYLSEVLQSNLREVRYLWIESELSLYFTLEEVLDLINASFEDNPRTREIIREIKQNPQPIQV
jgi:centromere/kinetochore protein ZW10